MCLVKGPAFPRAFRGWSRARGVVLGMAPGPELQDHQAAIVGDDFILFSSVGCLVAVCIGP